MHTAQKTANFELSFRYPTGEEREAIQIIHRDMTTAEQQQHDKRLATVESLLGDLEAGRLYREDLDPEVIERLTRLLKGKDDGD